MSRKTSSCNKCGKSFTRSTGLRKHIGTCTGVPAAVVPAVAALTARKRRTAHGVSPERLKFKLQKTREALDGNVQQFTVDVKGAKSLSTL